MNETTGAYTPSPEETLFTRIVRAIHNTGAEHGSSTTNGQLALAVLEAIREPTAAMLVAGMDGEGTWVRMADVAIEQARQRAVW